MRAGAIEAANPVDPTPLTSCGLITAFNVFQYILQSRERVGRAGLTESIDVVAVLDHLGGDVVIVDTRSGRVDAGEAKAAALVIIAPSVVVIGGLLGLLRSDAGTFAAVSAVVSLRKE